MRLMNLMILSVAILAPLGVLAKPNLKAVNREKEDMTIKEFEEEFGELINDPEKEKVGIYTID